MSLFPPKEDDALTRALLQAAKKTKNTPQKKENILEVWSKIAELKKAFETLDFIADDYSYFSVRDPVPREIFAPSFRDRVAHRFFVDAVSPLWEKRFYFDSYANREGKGVHRAVARLRQFLRCPNNAFFLKIDISKFFVSIDRTILLEIIKKGIVRADSFPEDKKNLLLHLAERFIAFTAIKSKKNRVEIPPAASLFFAPKGKGLPLGSLASQFFANVYLHELDHFAKQHLGIRCYLRYSDDVMILGDSAHRCHYWEREIRDFAQKKLQLSLNPVANGQDLFASEAKEDVDGTARPFFEKENGKKTFFPMRRKKIHQAAMRFVSHH